MELSPGKMWGLRRLADSAGRFSMMAVDQRPPIQDLVASRRGVADARYEDVVAVKELLIEELAPVSSAMLLDPHYAYPTGVGRVRPDRGLLLTLEDSVFEETPTGRRSKTIDDWTVEKIKRVGADAVKVLAWYRPDADVDTRRHQQEFVARIGDECRRFDIPYVFELLVYSFPDETDHTSGYVEQPKKRAEHVLESVATFAHPRFGVDLFKIESPINAQDVPEPGAGADHSPAAAAAQALFDELGSLAGRPWVMLSAGAGKEAFRRILVYAYRAGASGYLAGRAIWWEALDAFPDLEAVRASLRRDGRTYVDDLNELTASAARPWFEHPTFGNAPFTVGSGVGFRQSYPGMDHT